MTKITAKKNTLITLAQNLGLANGTEYFDYCRDSYINGQKAQCKELFNDMSTPDKRACLAYLFPYTHGDNSIEAEECFCFLSRINV